jgi:hypothetical protein
MWNDRQIAVETNYKANNILHVLYFYIFYIFLWLPSVAELNVGDSYIPIKISNQYLIERPKKVWSTKVWTKSTSSRAITQPKIIRPERYSNLNCRRPLIYWLDIWYAAISRWVTVYIWISFWSNDFWLSHGPWTCIFCSNV